MNGSFSLFLIVSLNLIILFVIYHSLKKRIDNSSSAEHILKSVRDEVDRMLVELNQTTERNIALLENKLNYLNSVMEQADKKIKVLEREKEKQDLSRKIYSELNRNKRTVAEEKDYQEEVINLFNSGVAENVIAKRLNLPIGEVQLIISLNSSKR
ncbi:MAG: hypothetical protein DRP57_00040 [Spirochaetes bacterium]|nr:MAG: hypothetical protein DRP57_00040 [Spirochaetota bacterium]